MKALNQINQIAQQAVWHFIQGYKDGYAVGAIVDPWKYGYTQNRQLDLYPEWSELCLDYEFELVAALHDETAQHEFLEDFDARAELIIAKF